jgi:formyl-CoA transferase
MEAPQRQPLAGVRVLELGSLIAGPYAAALFAQFGAEVIKIEPPDTGDPLRVWRELHAGTSLWWYSQSRNKKSVTLDLKTSQGQQIVRDLAATADVVIENFKPGTLDKWGIGWTQLSAVNPGLIMVRVSGYGQTGPKRSLPGFAAIAEAIGGLRYVTGFPDRSPVRAGVSIGDTLGSLYAVIGALLALHDRKVNGGMGQVVDVALYEAVFAAMESLLPDFSVKGVIRQRSGAAIPGVVPSNTYRCSDGKEVIIAGNSDGIFRRLMGAIGRSDLASEPALSRNDGRVKAAGMLDEVIQHWCSQRTFPEVVEMLQKADVPVGGIYSVADIAADEQFKARGMIEEAVLADGTPIQIPGIVPKLSATPGETRWLGPQLGAHTREILARVGIGESEYEMLRKVGIV